jgi:hypothetical protein
MCYAERSLESQVKDQSSNTIPSAMRPAIAVAPFPIRFIGTRCTGLKGWMRGDNPELWLQDTTKSGLLGRYEARAVARRSRSGSTP